MEQEAKKKLCKVIMDLRMCLPDGQTIVSEVDCLGHWYALSNREFMLAFEFYLDGKKEKVYNTIKIDASNVSCTKMFWFDACGMVFKRRFFQTGKDRLYEITSEVGKTRLRTRVHRMEFDLDEKGAYISVLYELLHVDQLGQALESLGAYEFEIIVT